MNVQMQTPNATNGINLVEIAERFGQYFIENIDAISIVVVVLIGALGCLALFGGGEFSIDGRRELTSARRAAGRARLRGKV